MTVSNRVVSCTISESPLSTLRSIFIAVGTYLGSQSTCHVTRKCDYSPNLLVFQLNSRLDLCDYKPISLLLLLSAPFQALLYATAVSSMQRHIFLCALGVPKATSGTILDYALVNAKVQLDQSLLLGRGFLSCKGSRLRNLDAFLWPFCASFGIIGCGLLVVPCQGRCGRTRGS